MCDAHREYKFQPDGPSHSSVAAMDQVNPAMVISLARTACVRTGTEPYDAHETGVTTFWVLSLAAFSVGRSYFQPVRQFRDPPIRKGVCSSWLSGKRAFAATVPRRNSALNTIFQSVHSEKPSKLPLIILGYALAIAFMAWVLRDFHIVKALREIANVDWKWVILAIVLDIISYGIQALRWKWLLSPFGHVRLTRSIRAVFAGLFANIVFPLRPGEFLRSYLLSNSEQISMGRVLGSVGVERLVDLVIATASLGVVSLVVELPRRFDRMADILGVVTLVVISIVVGIIFYLEVKLGDANPEPSPQPGITSRVMGALTALHAMGTAPSFYPALLTSLFMPLCQIGALWAMMRSYGLDLPFLASVVVVLVINLGVSLPNAPANVGSYQFFCVLGLSVFQVDKSSATGFSFFAFVMLTLPFFILGFIALIRSGLSLRSMREKVGGMPVEVAGSVSRP